MSRNRARVAIIMPGLVSARIPFLNQLCAATATNLEIQPVVFLMNGIQVGREEAILAFKDAMFDLKILNSLTLRHRTKAGDTWPVHINPALLWHLEMGEFDAVVVLQWTALYSLPTLLYMKLRSRPVILWEESISHPASRSKRLLFPLIKRVFRGFDACIAASSRCKEYLVEMGAKPEGVFVAGTPIDSDFFTNRALAVSDDEKENLKSELGIAEKQVILFVGQLIPRKGIMVLLDAFRQLRQKRDNVAMLILGSGLLHNQIQEFLRVQHLDETVRVIGFVQHTDLPRYAAISDVFVLPSLYDAFPVAIHEAMACGLPVITTEMVGATPDLVKNGFNGLVVPPNDCDALHNALDEILKHADRRQQMANASLEIISGWTIDKAVSGFSEAVQCALASKGMHR